jgi:1-acyl-sn-glycerol-3-phosphate acyltransferase
MSIRTAIQALRTAVFYLVFIGQTVVLAVVLGTIAKIAGRTRIGTAIAHFWCSSNLVYLRTILGVKTDVQGAENIPAGGCIIASKHQSDWDIFALFPHIRRPAFIAKKELMRIPFFGWAALSIDCIEVDRQRGSSAIPKLLEQSRQAIDRGCQIVIYPEGTRKAPLAPPDYRQGIVRMYTELNVPVVPVALNAGLFWGRNSAFIWPGTAKARFLEPIQPGLSPEDFLERLRTVIEAESNRLILEAEAEGLQRPIDAKLKQRLAALHSSNTTTS